MLSIKQQQQFLKGYKGLYKGKIDGIKGKHTLTAIKAFQGLQGLKKDGIWGAKTESKAQPLIWAKYPNFKRSEFVCKCSNKNCEGKKKEVEFALLDIVQKIRNRYGKAVHINSGLRCEKHNKAVGGVAHSRHKQGKAVDIHVYGISGKALRKTAYDLGCRYSYIIKGDNVHIDVK